MGREEICARLRRHAEMAVAENNATCLCRETVSKLKSLINEDGEVSQYLGKVLTVYYRTGDSERTIWDHCVLTAKLIPDLVVIEPRMHFLAEESGGQRLTQSAVFIGDLRAWQLRLERSTRSVIVHYEWSDLLPGDMDCVFTIAQVLGPRKKSLSRVVVK